MKVTSIDAPMGTDNKIKESKIETLQRKCTFVSVVDVELTVRMANLQRTLHVIC